jgi:hypothetical protein
MLRACGRAGNPTDKNNVTIQVGEFSHKIKQIY